MLRYVEEEVDRVKGLFEQKEARLTSERDSAKQAAQRLAQEQEQLTQKLHKLEQEMQHLPAALEVIPSSLLSTRTNLLCQLGLTVATFGSQNLLSRLCCALP